MEINPNLSEKAKYDLELVQRAINNDQKAYAELMARYKDAIYFMLLKMINNKTDAEDLTIEAFGKAFKNLKQYSPNYAFSTWLFKIASNNCIDYLRKKRNNHISIDSNHTSDEKDSEPQVHLKDETPDPEENLIRAQKVVLMRTVVKKLKPRYRTLIELRYFKEYSYEEISDELELPLGTVKAQLFRARELLFNTLKNTEVKKL
ncbi:RNA polymerase sigma factor [Thermophagus xiamenensis]|uniref:RNA polymerase sigma-70 factor, ECF subfamily n=1 Tax=Thermophagus xiamenensis TaxID=385682 RepID=A0A1I2ADF4_9BACT|nr:sigma-70 family RNA polymerase sigma factor [Thermophagus xiamenensis]SFE41578.1 RNA polymerase sigma-70 factor, ECF subfamily [Thermophagus xiamenensis]